MANVWKHVHHQHISSNQLYCPASLLQSSDASSNESTVLSLIAKLYTKEDRLCRTQNSDGSGVRRITSFGIKDNCLPVGFGKSRFHLRNDVVQKGYHYTSLEEFRNRLSWYMGAVQVVSGNPYVMS